MSRRLAALVTAACLAACSNGTLSQAIPPAPAGDTLTPADIISASKPEEWRRLDPETTLYMDFPAGRVVIEMAPSFSPAHVANVKALAREGYFKSGAVTRVQDNFVAQWSQAADPPRPPRTAKERLPPEFHIPRASPVEFTPLPDPDTYAPEVGFSNGFPVASDGARMWIAHCYGVVGVGREEDPGSGGGTELYAVIGHSPRNIDRQLSILGRVVQGMEILSALPRGTGDIGFYKTPAENQRFIDIQVAADVPVADRTNLEVMRTDSESFATLVNARRWRKDAFYRDPVGRIGLCNVTPPVRVAG
jgi:peptidylprolyl isomerase